MLKKKVKQTLFNRKVQKKKHIQKKKISLLYIQKLNLTKLNYIKLNNQNDNKNYYHLVILLFHFHQWRLVYQILHLSLPTNEQKK